SFLQECLLLGVLRYSAECQVAPARVMGCSILGVELRRRVGAGCPVAKRPGQHGGAGVPVGLERLTVLALTSCALAMAVGLGLGCHPRWRGAPPRDWRPWQAAVPCVWGALPSRRISRRCHKSPFSVDCAIGRA